MTHRLLLTGAAILALFTPAFAGGGAMTTTSGAKQPLAAMTSINPYLHTADAIRLPMEDSRKETMLLEALAAKPDFADASFRLGDYYEQTGQYDKAAKAYDEAMAHDPAHRGYAELRARLYASMGRHSEGIARLSQDLTARPEHPHLYGQLAFLEHDREQFEAAANAARAWLALDAKEAEAWFWLGKAQLGLRQFDAAHDSLAKAVSLKPSVIKYLKEVQMVAIASERYAAGIDYFLGQTETQPDNDQAWLFLSELYRLEGNLDRAHWAAERRAEILGPNTNVDALNTVASVLEAGGNFEDALRKLFTAEKIQEHPEFVHDRIKDIIFQLGKIDEGTAYFKRLAAAKQVEPHVYRILGELAFRASDFEAAKLWNTHYLEGKPYKALAYSHLGIALANTGNERAALEAFQKAAWFNLNIRDNFHRVAALYHKLEMTAEGITFFENVISYMPEKPELHLYVAALYEAAGRKDAAAQSLLTAAGLRPVSIDTPELRAKVAALRDTSVASVNR